MIQLYRFLLLASFNIAASPLWAQNPAQLHFDGADDKVTIPNTALNSIGDGDFTVEAWIRGEEALQGQHPRILSNRPSAGSGFMLQLHDYWGGSQYKMLSVQLEGFNYLFVDNGAYNASLLDGTCHHVAVTRATDSLHLYADGILIGSRLLQTAAPTVASTATSMSIGWDVTDNYSFNGDISQVRIWDHARMQSAIQADMNYSIPGTTTGLVGYWELNEGSGQIATDKTALADGLLGTQAAVDANDPAWISDGCPIIPEPLDGCLTFDGVEDRVTIPNVALNVIGPDDFTVEAEVRGVESEQGPHARILSNRPTAGVGFMLQFHDLWGGSQYKMLSVQLEGLNYLLINNGTYNGSLLDGLCHHVAVTRTNDSLYFSADGIHIGTQPILAAGATTGSGLPTMSIGRDVVDNYSFNGNISQVRIWDHARTQAEIQQAMSVSIPGNTPGLLGYWELNEGSGQWATDLSANANGELGFSSTIETVDPDWVLDCCSAGNMGIVDAEGDGAFALWPNPTSGVVWLEVPPGGAWIHVVDALGRTVHAATKQAAARQYLDLGHLGAGTYTVAMRTAAGMRTALVVKEQ